MITIYSVLVIEDDPCLDYFIISIFREVPGVVHQVEMEPSEQRSKEIKCTSSRCARDVLTAMDLVMDI
jgi:hypothetical protein